MSDLLQFGSVDRGGTASGSNDVPTEEVSFIFHRIQNTAGGTDVAMEELVIVHEGFQKDGSFGLTAEGGEHESSAHPGGTHFAFGDGSVRFVSESLDLL
jgi:prepilin-type processing-associated H-X9-DG protein